MKKRTKITLLFLFSLLLVFGCNLPTTKLYTPFPTPQKKFSILPPDFTPDLTPEEYIGVPTPDAPHTLPSIEVDSEFYIVKSNDTLGIIANKYGISLVALMEANQISDPDFISPGQGITIPPPIIGEMGPSYKLIPNSELVDGPKNAGFDIFEYINQFDGQISLYREDVQGKELSGTEIVAMISNNYSVNPRLLVAILEFQSGMLTTKQPLLDDTSFPMGLEDSHREGLFFQLAWAADTLNRGYYLWQSNGLSAFLTADGKLIPAHPEINAGTAAVQYLFAKLYDENSWRQAISEVGFTQSFQQLFGNPFSWTVDPILPMGLRQPEMQLPFEEGVAWNFTGGPHGGWDNGSPWAAIEFAPKMEVLGCNSNDAWVVAMSDGLIVYANDGMVIQDLDGDGYAQTEWAVTYMHISYENRVNVGTYLYAGDRIGHPSCEGGYSTGTHVHIARRYNGVWIHADAEIPFLMDGWMAVGTGDQYGGSFSRGDQVVEVCNCQDEKNSIQR